MLESSTTIVELSLSLVLSIFASFVLKLFFYNFYVFLMSCVVFIVKYSSLSQVLFFVYVLMCA